MKRVIVIGGGPAGMMAAIAAAEGGATVLLLEKNEKLGKKLYITGKGRCNVTNGADVEELLNNVVTNPKFLFSAFYGFDNRQLMELLEAEGCALKEERGKRIFPVSNHASDVTAALSARMKKLGVTVRLNTEVTALLKEPLVSENGMEHDGNGTVDGVVKKNAQSAGKVTGVLLKNGHMEQADAVIVCTGGLAYPSTGSTGDGLRFAKNLELELKNCRPSLVPLETKENWCRELMGLSLKNVKLTMRDEKRILYEEQGEMLFTHFGVSGPLVLTGSCYLGKAKGDVTLWIDMKPALSEAQLDDRILRDFAGQEKKQVLNACGGLLPSKMLPILFSEADVLPDKKVCEITKEERLGLVRALKGICLHVTGTRSFAESIITQGGVSVKEINPSTMEAKKWEGLYFAGEVLDLDAHTGGYNLQIAWSTGHLAGGSAAEMPEA